MWSYQKHLQYPIHIKNPDARAAQVIISQYGGPDGEIGASLRYLSQRYAMPNAQLAGIDSVTGSVEAGKAADLIVCDRDPLADLTALRSLHMVIKDGVRIEHPAVKKLPEVERELDKFL